MKKLITMLLPAMLAASISVDAQNIVGTITCDGVGVAGVVVSDGYVVTTTNSEGYYEIASEKKNGYVFYSIPSGYMPYVNPVSKKQKLLPPFYSVLKSTDVSELETKNFKLVKEENDKHVMVVGADAHIANRFDDVNQFVNGFIGGVIKEKDAAGSTPVYSTIVGDLSWDNYWYSNNCDPNDVISVFSNNNYPVRLFAVMGNHDNDGATPESEDTDFLSTAYWRKYIAPNYYSYNIGKIHYVVLDDIFYKNTDTGESYRTGIVGSRDYDCTLINDVIEWLKKDLSYVSHDTPVILELHAPAFKLNTTTATNFSPYTALANSSTEALCEIVKDYKKVHIWSGHLHYNYHAFPEEYPNIHENNIAAICAIWWKSGYLCGRHICADGTPGGYEVYYMDGDSIRWQYHSLEDNGNAQFRVYDSNALIDYYNTNQSIKEILEEKPKKKNWGNTDPDNLFVNVFNYDPSWKIEAYENGELVNMSHVYTEDPLHQATFNVPYHETYPSDVSGITTNKTSHFFKIKPKSGTTPIDFRITDRFGNIYTKTVTRPLAFDIQELDSNDAEMATVIETKIEDGARISTYGNIICIDSDCSCKAVIAMVNGSYNLIDVNPGHNEYNMPAAGFYIVKVGNKASKVLLR